MRARAKNRVPVPVHGAVAGIVHRVHKVPGTEYLGEGIACPICAVQSINPLVGSRTGGRVDGLTGSAAGVLWRALAGLLVWGCELLRCSCAQPR